MKAWKLIVSVVVFGGLAALLAGTVERSVIAQEASFLADPYEVVPDWPKPLGQDLDWTRTPSVYAESPNRVYVLQTGQVPVSYRQDPVKDAQHPNWPHLSFPGLGRCAIGKNCTASDPQIIDPRTKKPFPGAKWEHLMNVFDAKGNLVESWPQEFDVKIGNPHGVQIDKNDPERHVWVLDNGYDQILKYTHDGKQLVQTIGVAGMPASDKTHLGGPSGMAFYPNGDFFVTDGYKNFRVVKFGKDGQYMMEWGTKGTGPGQFDTPHSVEILTDGRVIVGDRGNKRVQFFDRNGKYLTEIFSVYPNDLAVSTDEKWLYVCQGGPDGAAEIRTYSIAGEPRLVASWGVPMGNKAGQLWGPHGFSRDSDGNMYFGESWGGRVWKYRVKRGQKPTFLPFAENNFKK